MAKFVREPALSAIGGTVLTPVMATSDKRASDGEITPADHQSVVDDINQREERAFVWRLDLGLLSIGFLGYMFKYIDQTNISNAYVSGMQEDLSLYGNELNYFTTYFNIGYMIMLYPSCIIISHFGPSKWLPACEIMWGILTCSLSVVTEARQVYGLRFLIGLFEGSAWPGYFTIISQWYMPHEIALRMSLYNIAQPAGAMLSGAMQGALSTNLEDALGRSGWRWAFIINGVCTIFVSLAAFFILPGYVGAPELYRAHKPNEITDAKPVPSLSARIHYQNSTSSHDTSVAILQENEFLRCRLTGDEEIALARARRVGRKPQIGITVKSFLRCFTFWQLWLFAIAWPIGGNTVPSNYFNLWLKSLKNSDGTKKYTVGMLNYLPIIGQAAQLAAELVFSGLSDLFGVRLPFLLLHSGINITSLIILIIRPSNEHTYMAGWYMNYLGGVSMMLLLSWASTRLQDEPELRTVLFASGTILAYLMNAFIPLAAYPASEAPHWRIGAKLYLGFAATSTLMFVGIHFAFKREEKKKVGKTTLEVGIGGQLEGKETVTRVSERTRGISV